MDYFQINDVLSRANADFERRELEDLRAYEADDISDSIEPDFDVFEHIEKTHEEDGFEQESLAFSDASNQEEDVSYVNFVAEAVSDIAIQFGFSQNDALDAFEKIANQMAEEGVIPAMPSVESSTQEELSAWVNMARENELVSRVERYVKTGKM